MILIVVYVGAVAVLFLFVVMMLDINFIKLREGFINCKTKEEEREFGLAYIAELCDLLLDYNTDGLHFYTLNRATAFIEIAKRMKSKMSK